MLLDNAGRRATLLRHSTDGKVIGAPIQERLNKASFKFNPVLQTSSVHNLLFEIVFNKREMLTADMF